MEWANSMKKYMDGVKDMMLTGVDQFTKALSVA